MRHKKYSKSGVFIYVAQDLNCTAVQLCADCGSCWDRPQSKYRRTVVWFLTKNNVERERLCLVVLRCRCSLIACTLPKMFRLRLFILLKYCGFISFLVNFFFF